MPRAVRDALYGYVGISRIEARLLGRPEALRLHRILQSSTVYHTYVNNRGSRFAHSVGAMHVAGRLYHSLAKKFKPPQANDIKSAAEKVLQRISVTSEEVRKYLDNTPDELYSGLGWTSERWVDVMLFQAVRLAA